MYFSYRKTLINIITRNLKEDNYKEAENVRVHPYIFLASD